jgi:hypothetical protein
MWQAMLFQSFPFSCSFPFSKHFENRGENENEQENGNDDDGLEAWGMGYKCRP